MGDDVTPLEIGDLPSLDHLGACSPYIFRCVL